MRQAIKSGVSAYIVEGIHAQRLQPILDVAMARFESDQALRAHCWPATSNWPSASASSWPKGC
jgi:response regulator NasT